MADPQIRVGVDVGCKTHQVGIAGPDGAILAKGVKPSFLGSPPLTQGVGPALGRVRRIGEAIPKEQITPRSPPSSGRS